MAPHAVCHGAGERKLPGAVRVPLSARAAWQPAGFLAFEVPALPPGAPAPELRLGGVALRPPVLRLALGEATLLLARAPEGCAEGAELELRRGGDLISLGILGAPSDPTLLLAARPAAEAAELLRRLVAAAPAFPARGGPGAAVLCRRLGGALAEGLPMARPLAGGGAGDRLSLWQLPRPASPSGEGWTLIPAAASPRPVPAPGPGARAILLDGLPGQGALLLPPEGPPVPLAAAAEDLPGLLALARRGGVARQALLDLLAPRARAEAPAAALLRDLQLLSPLRAARLDDPALPVGGALELALPDGEGGVFLRGWLRDPLGLVEGLALCGPGGAVPVPADALHRLTRTDLVETLRRAPQGDGGPRPGFLAWLPEAGLPPGTAQLVLELRLRSGQRVTLAAPPGLLPSAAARDLVLASAAPGELTEAAMAGCIAPVVARLQRAAMAPGAPPERMEFGPPPARRAARRPVARIVVPLWRRLDFLRAQFAGFARDPEFRGVAAPELVYVLDSPEQREEAAEALRGLALLHDLPATLLVHDRNRGYASACNSGAEGAATPLLAFLNSDVIAAGSGWLGALRRRLARDARMAAVGAKLLYPDGAIQHAGLFFAPAADGGWGSNHYFKGLPAAHPPAGRARHVPAATGAALAVRRAAFAAAGGFCTDYVLGDFEDSDLCLKLRAAGHAIGYEPAAELVHHERQSIAAHPGHARTLAAGYNRRLHDARWGAAIAALMRRHPHPEG